MIFAGIVAGGTGTRMGADKPKQFLDLCGKPIIIHTIEKFCSVDEIDKIYIGVHPDWVEYCIELLSEFKLKSNRISVIPGGNDRNSTVFNIVGKIDCEYKLNDNDIILTHDAVRPFVTESIIKDNITSTIVGKACGTYIPSVDTIINSVDGKIVTSVPERKEMYQAQTPQSFNIIKLKETYLSLSDKEKSLLTDTCSVFTVKGLPVHIVQGDIANMKITTVKDFEIAKVIAKLDN